MATKITGKQIDLTSFDTDDVGEGSLNLYYTDTRTRAAVSGGGDLSYNSATGVFSVTTYKSADFNNDFSGKTSDNLTEGSSNLYYTNARVATTLAALSAQTIGGVTSTITFGDDVVITGDLTVNGSTTTINTSEINLEDNVIVINSGQTGTPASSLRSGIEVERGDSANVVLQFNENDDAWEFSMWNPDSSSWDLVPLITMAQFSAGTGLSFDNAGQYSISSGGVDSNELASGAVTAAKLNQTSGAEAVVAQAIRNDAVIADKIKIKSVGGALSGTDVSNGYIDFAGGGDPDIYSNSAFIVDQAHPLTAVYLNGLKLNLDPSTGTAIGTGFDATIGQNNGKLRLFLNANLISSGDGIEVILMFNS